MYTIDLLDSGYVGFVESWGSEEQIIEAARMSTNKGFQGWESDAKLLDYLYKNKHSTPFEMAGLVIEVKAPIFVFREWHGHRTQSYNEMSARYVPLPDENYMPSTERLLSGSASVTTNKQAQGSGVQLDAGTVADYLFGLDTLYKRIEDFYQESLKAGVPRELARIVIPVGRYSKMRASANLRNWLGFLDLRTAENAQWEIRQYANAVGEMIADRFPRTWELFQQERRGKIGEHNGT